MADDFNSLTESLMRRLVPLRLGQAEDFFEANATMQAASQNRWFDDLITIGSATSWTSVAAKLAITPLVDPVLDWQVFWGIWVIQVRIERLLTSRTDPEAAGMRGSAWWSLARAFDARDMFEYAKPFYRDAVVALREAGDHDSLALCLSEHASCLIGTDRNDEARVILAEALPMLLEYGSPRSHANALIDCAGCYLDAGQPRAALAHYQDAERRFSALEDGRWVAGCLMNQALCLDHLGQDEEAEALYLNAQRLLSKHGTALDLANCQMNHGLLLEDDDRFAEAVECYAKAGPVLRKFGTPVKYANCASSHADCLLALRRNVEAEALYAEAEPILEKDGDRDIYLLCLTNHGQCLGRLERYQGALNKYVKQELLLRAEGSPLALADSVQMRALCLRQLGRHREALILYGEAEQILQPLLDPLPHALCLLDHSVCLGEIGRLVDAQAMLIQAESIIEVSGTVVNRSGALRNRAILLDRLGREFEARVIHEEAVDILRPHQDTFPTELAESLIAHAICLGMSEQEENAIPLYVEAAKLLRDHGTPVNYAKCRSAHASSLERLERFRAALPLFAEAETILERERPRLSLARCYVSYAECLRSWSNRRDDARTRYEQALALISESGPTPEGEELRWRALGGLSAVLEDEGDIRGAAAHLDVAISIVEALADEVVDLEDRISRRANHSNLYRHAVSLEFSRQDAPAAFMRAQQAKARTLADLLAVRLTPAIPTPTVERALHVSRTVRSVADLAASLQAGEALLDYLDLGSSGRIAIFLLLPRKGLEFAAMVEGDEISHTLVMLEQECDHLLRSNRRPHVQAEPTPSLEYLYEVLIAPVAEKLMQAATQRLIVSPSGRLHAVPFAALWRWEKGSMRFLIDDFEVAATPAATSLWLFRRLQRQSLPPRLLAIAPFAVDPADGRKSRPVFPNADPSSTPWLTDPLRHSTREVREVAALVAAAYPKERHTVLERGDATRRSVAALAPSASLILAATHGSRLKEGESVLDFRLHFAPEPDGTADMSVLDVYRGALRLDAATHVLLTACHLGDVIRRGEEVLGFAQAFLSAGAGVVLAPLWAVDGAAVAALSIAYHKYLLGTDRPTVALAMRRAMIEVRSQPRWSHPVYWAAFTPNGDPALRLQA